MKPLYLVSLLPGGVLIVILIALLLFAVVAYALYSKGDVRVVISRGKTRFALEGKEKRASQ
jgi:hypothetical protein